MRKFIDIVTLNEGVFYKGEINPYGIDVSIEVLKDPSKRDLDRLLARSSADPAELRGILAEDGFYVWDGHQMEHAGISKTFGIRGLNLFVYEGEWSFQDYYLRHPDLRAEAIEMLRHPSIARAFGETEFSQEGRRFPR